MDYGDFDAFLNAIRQSTDSALSRAAIRGHVERALEDPTRWMSELCELNDTGTPDAEFIADTLSYYNENQPWTIDKETLEQTRRVVKGNPSDGSDEVKRPPLPLISLLGIPRPFESLPVFFKRHEEHFRPMCESVLLLDPGELGPVNEASSSDTAVATVDQLLGIAGFLPDLGGEDNPLSLQEVRNEFQLHLQVRKTDFGSCIDISMANPRQKELVDQLGRISSLYRRLSRAIRTLRQNGLLGDCLSYLRRRRVPGGKTSGAENDGLAVEIAAINLDVLESLFADVEDCVQKSLPDKVDNTFVWSSLGLGMAATAVSAAVPLLGLAFSLGTTGFGYWYSQRKSLRLRLQIERIQNLGLRADPKLASLELPERRGPQENTPSNTLHRLATTGQFLSLVLQSHIRGFQAPFEFENIMDRPISQFCLHGLDKTAKPLFAFSQKISCLPDTHLLVFDTSDVFVNHELDLRATPAAIMNLWHPAKLLIRTDVG